MNKNTDLLNSQSPQENKLCPECGSGNLKISEEEYRFPYGIGGESLELTANVKVEKCKDCGFSYLGQEAEKACHNAICDHLGLMKPSQIKSLRDYYGITQSEFSKITGLGEATLSRWERGIVIQNKAYDNYLYLLGLDKNFHVIREREESAKPIEPTLKSNKKPQFRDLNVNEEVIERKRSFKLHHWEPVG